MFICVICQSQIEIQGRRDVFFFEIIPTLLVMLDCTFEIAVFVCLVSFLEFPCLEEYPAEEANRGEVDGAWGATSGQEDCQSEKNHRGQQEELVFGLEVFDGLRFDLVLLCCIHQLKIDFPKVEVVGGDGEVDAPRSGTRHLPQGLAVQFRTHGFAVVAKDLLAAILVGQGKQGAILVIANADGQQARPVGADGFGGFHRHGVVVLTVCDEDDVPSQTLLFIKDAALDGTQCVPQVCATAGDRVNGEFRKHHTEESVVLGQGAENGGVSRKCHQRDPVPGKCAHAVLDFRFGPFQTVWTQVLRQHTLGDVH